MSSSTPIDAFACAALFAKGKTQLEIARALNLSQSNVSRLLRDVQEYIRVERAFEWDWLDPSTRDKVRRRISPRELADRLAAFAALHRQPAPEVHVVPVAESDDKGAKFESFAQPAAQVLRELLERVLGRVGVAWGSTIWHTAQALRSTAARPFRDQQPIEFIPLCGDPLIDSRNDYADRTSSRIVSELSRTVNGDKTRPAWLGLVPAFIPRRFDKKKIRVIDELIDLVPQYGRIFGPRQSPPTEPPLAADLHMIVTAAGPSNRPLGFGGNPLLYLSESEAAILAESIYGDIGGVLLPRPEKIAEAGPGRSLVEELTTRWTGLKLKHLRDCSQRAFAEPGASRPGVTLLSFGTDHVDVVLQAVREGLVNHLIVGSDLEPALTREL